MDSTRKDDLDRPQPAFRFSVRHAERPADGHLASVNLDGPRESRMTYCTVCAGALVVECREIPPEPRDQAGS